MGRKTDLVLVKIMAFEVWKWFSLPAVRCWSSENLAFYGSGKRFYTLNTTIFGFCRSGFRVK